MIPDITRRTMLCGLAGLVVARPATAALAKLPPATLRRIDTICRSAVEEKRTAGLAIQVQSGGAALFAKGYGYANIETRSVTTPASVFRVGSISKQFTAAAVLLLSEDGRLSLDDPLGKFLPDFPRAAEVTIRQLLNHTSGIQNISKGIMPAIDYSTSQIIDVIRAQQPLYGFDPGTQWSYSNTAYWLAGAVIEHVTQRPFWELYQQRLFAPAGLSATAVDRPADIVFNRAAGYTRAASAPGFANISYLSWSIPGPAGALRSTVEDLCRWHDALIGGRILEPETLTEMTTPARLKDGRLASAGRPGPAAGTQPDQEYGLGLELSTVQGHRRIGHYGSIWGYAADLGSFPDLGLTVAVLTNTDFSDQNPPREIEATLLADLKH